MKISKIMAAVLCGFFSLTQGVQAGFNTVCYLTAASYATVEGTAISGTVARQAESTTLMGDWNLASAWNVTITVDASGQTYPISSQDLSGKTQYTFTIPANQYNTAFSIPIAQNSSLEYDRSATLRVSGNVTTQGARQSAPATVLDNDSRMWISVVQSNVAYSGIALFEGGLGGSDRATIRFNRDSSVVQARTVNFNFSGANNGVDFTPSLGNSVTIAQGTSTVDVPIRILSDTLLEGIENLNVWITSGTYAIDTGNSNITVQIVDDYPTVTVTAVTNTIPEGYSMGVAFVRSPAYICNTNKTINYHFSGTAINGLDYSFASSAVISNGYSGVSVPFTVLQDNLVEGVENVTVTLDPGVYTVGSPGSLALNLVDDYATVNVTTTEPIAQEQLLTPGVFTLTRTGNLSLGLTVHYTVGGTATPGLHYQTLSQTATFGAWVTSLNIPVTPINDGVYGAAKSVVITLQSDPSYLLGINTQASVTIMSETPEPGRTPVLDGRYFRAAPHPGTFLSDGSVFWDYYSFVLALDKEQGVTFDNVNGSLASGFVNRQWTDTRYHINCLYALWGYSQTNIANRTSFNNPIVAFGGAHGGSQLFTGQQYSFGVYAGSPYPNYQPIRVAVYNRASGAYVGQTLVPVPNPYSLTNWTNFANGGFETSVSGFGLTTTLRYTPSLSFGAGPDGCFVLVHEADSTATTNYYLVETTAYASGIPMAVTASGAEAASRLYTLEFDNRPPWRATVLDIPQFQGTPLPPEYDGKSLTELLAVRAGFTNQLPPSSLGYTNLNQSPELRRHPLLDQLVSNLRNDPIELANYVQNEIDLVDPVGMNDDGPLSEQALNLGGVNRGALGVYLEGEGSPMEQCALLVYLLRQANVPASYVFAPSQGVKLLDKRLSTMLRVQVRGGRDEEDNEFTASQNIAVNYPWVAAYVNGQWVHLFPWLKDYEVIEGLNLRDLMPATEPDGFSWVRDYVMGKTNLLAFGSATDITPGYIFPRWLANSMQQTAPKSSVDDVGLRWKLRRQNYSRWQDFPQPTWMTNTFTAIDTLSSSAITNVSPGLANVFNTVAVSVYSKANPQKVISTPALRMCDLQNRKFYITHVPYGGGYQLQMVLGAFGSNTNGSGTFTDADLLRKQQLNLNLDGTDDDLSIRLVINEHRAITPDLAIPLNYSFFNVGEQLRYAQERPLKKGDLAGLCFVPGRVTKQMLDVHARELWQEEKLLNGAGTPDPDIYNGTLVYLLGMTYFERASRDSQFFCDLTKIQSFSTMGYGLSKISAKRDAYGNLSGTPDFRRPALDMFWQNSMLIGNNTAHLESGHVAEEAERDYFLIDTAASSADEHQTLNVFFQETNAVSTVRLLQLAQKAATNGNPGVLFLNLDNANALGATYYQGAQLWSYDLWDYVVNIFNDPYNGDAALGFITPGPITSPSGNYRGMGFLGLGYHSCAAAIGANLNGAYATDLDAGAVGNANAGNINIRQDENDNYYVNTDPVNSSNKSLAPDVTSSFDRDNIASAVQSGYYVTSDEQNLASQQALNNGLIAGTPNTPNTTLGSETVQEDYTTGNAGNVGFFSKLWGTVADPVSPVSGEFYNDAVDLSLPGPFPVQLRRNYSSQNLADNQFGHGWKINYLPFLSINTNASVVYAAEMDGSTLAYERQGTNNLWKVTAARNPLLDNASLHGIGSIANLLRQYIVCTNSTYTLYGANGEVRTYQTGAFTGAPATKPFLMQWQDNRGNSLTFSYVTDASQPEFGELSRIQSSNGNALGLLYEAAGHIVAAYTEDGRWVEYEYDEYGDLVNVIRPDNSEIGFEYDHRSQNVTNGSSITSQVYSTHLLTREIKPDGRLLINQYDSQRRVTNQLATSGSDLVPIRNATFVYSNNFNITNSPTNGISGTTTIYDVFTNQTVYAYTNGLITNIVDALGIGQTNLWWQPNETNQTGYYARSLKRSIDRRGLVTDFYYDANGNVISNVVSGDLTGSGGTNAQSITATTYNVNNLPMDVTLPNGITMRTVYDPVFTWLPQQTIRLVGSTPISTNWAAYCCATNTVTNGSTIYVNVALGVLQKEIRAYGSVDAATNDWVIDGRGFPVQSTRYTGNTSDPSVTLTMFYNDRGELVEQRDAGGRLTDFTYDGMGRRESTEIIDETGKTVSWDSVYYNGNGEVTWSDGPAYGPEDYAWRDYDGAGRLTQLVRWRAQGNVDASGVSQPAGDAGYSTTWNEFDGFGNLKRTISPLGVVTTNSWDSIGRLIKRAVLETNGTVLTSESFTYEPGGKEHYHTNALGGVRETLYTSGGYPKFRRNEDGSTVGWLYYNDGRIYREIQPNGAYWETTSDFANFKTTRVFYTATRVPLATNVTIADRRGNVIQQIDAAQNIFTTTFDGLDRPKISTGPTVVSMTYSNAPGSISLPTTNNFVTNYYRQLTGYTYDNCGKVTSVTNVLGEKTVTTRDVLGRAVSVQVFDAGAGTPTRVTTTAYRDDHHGYTVTEGSGTGAVTSTVYTDNDGQAVLTIGSTTGEMDYVLNTFDVAGNRIESDQLSLISGQVYLWSYGLWSYNTLGQVKTETTRDNATTAFLYDSIGDLTNRVMPGGSLTWSATYSPAGQKLTEWNSGGGQTTRSMAYTYYQAGNSLAGLLNTVVDGSGVTSTMSYDDWLRVSSVGANGSLSNQQMTASWQYDCRGLTTNVTQYFASTNTGPKTVIGRVFDAYGQETSETMTLGAESFKTTQGWDAAGRRSQMGNTLFSAGFLYRSDGLMTASSGSVFTYGDNGLLTLRTNGYRYTTISSRDGEGRPQQATTHAGTNTLSEAWYWNGDGTLYSYTAPRGDFSDTRSFAYGSLHRRLTQETFQIASGQTITNSYTFDGGQAGGLGVLTKAGPPNSSGGAWTGTVDALSRISGETNTVLHRTAFGTVKGSASLRGDLNGRAVVLNYDSGGKSQWTADLSLSPGTNTLTVYAERPGLFTTNAIRHFTVATNALDQGTSQRDGSGNVTNRVWKNGQGQTAKTQNLTWDAFGRLIRVTERDTNNSGFNYDSIFDGLGRQLRTIETLVTNNVAMTTNPCPVIVTFTYDPAIQFQFFGINIFQGTQSRQDWLTYGPDVSGVYGGMQGVGGVEAISTSDDGNGHAANFGVLNDSFGNVVAGITNGKAAWNPSRVGLYGPADGYAPARLSLNGPLYASLALRSRPITVAGTLQLGMRPYDIARRSFLSFDPAWNGGDPNGFSSFRGNPGMYFDPTGMYGKRAWDETKTDADSLTSGVFWGGMGSDLYSSGARTVNGVVEAGAIGSDMIGQSAAQLAGYGDEYQGYSKLYQSIYNNPQNGPTASSILAGTLEAEANIGTCGLYGMGKGFGIAAATGDFTQAQDASFASLLMSGTAYVAPKISAAIQARAGAYLDSLLPDYTLAGAQADAVSVEPQTGPYGTLAGDLSGSGLQANHLNQNAAFKSIIPENEGLAVGMRGNAFTEIGSPHYEFHASLEEFWAPYRKGGNLAGQLPSNAQYGNAVRQALIRSGYTPTQATSVANQAAAQRAAYQLVTTAPVPRVPGRLPQTKP